MAIALIAMLPWWGWTLLAGAIWIVGRMLMASELPGKGVPAHILSLNPVLGAFFSYLGPIIGVMLAVISARARRRAAIARSTEHISPQPTNSRDPYREPEHSGQARVRASIDTTSWNLGLIKALEWKRLEQLVDCNN